MQPDCQLRAFNVKVTDSSIIAPPLCPHSCPPMLVLSFGTTGKVALDGVLLFPFMAPIRRGQDGPRRCLPVALGLPQSSSDVSLLDLDLGLDIKMGQGTQILQPPNIYIYIYIGNSLLTFPFSNIKQFFLIKKIEQFSNPIIQEVTLF